MRTVAIACTVVFLVCVIAFPVIDYAGGRKCTPLMWGLWPAGIIPCGVGLLAVGILIGTVVRSLVARRHRLWAIGALAAVFVAALVYRSFASQFPGFLEGLRDRFVGKVGYPTMREFAREVSQIDRQTMISRPVMGGSLSAEQQKRWSDLVSRYSFLDWTCGGHVRPYDGIVQAEWGSPLTGHWGFQVSPGDAVTDLEEDEGSALRVADDIQFVYYYD